VAHQYLFEVRRGRGTDSGGLLHTHTRARRLHALAGVASHASCRCVRACSCGTYGWGPLMRQVAPHEVTLLVLRSAAVVGPDFAGSVRYLKCTSVAGCV